MLQNTCKTLGYEKNMVYEIPPTGMGKQYLASGLIPLYTLCMHAANNLKRLYICSSSCKPSLLVLVCLFVMILYVPVSNFSVMS